MVLGLYDVHERHIPKHHLLIGSAAAVFTPITRHVFAFLWYSTFPKFSLLFVITPTAFYISLWAQDDPITIALSDLF